MSTSSQAPEEKSGEAPKEEREEDDGKEGKEKEKRITRSSARKGGEGEEAGEGKRLSIFGQEDESANGSKASTSRISANDQTIRVGHEFQAELPKVVGAEERTRSFLDGIKEPATCHWSPEFLRKVDPSEFEDFCNIAASQHKYTIEQALGVLHHFDYNIKTARRELKAYVPIHNEWSAEDKVLFEQAFSMHGKHFAKIRQSLPHKTIANLVEYYYLWKNTRNLSSYMDQENDYDSYEEESDNGGPADEKGARRPCSNCRKLTVALVSSSAGLLCNVCHAYWKRTGYLRPRTRKGQMTAEEEEQEGSRASQPRDLLALEERASQSFPIFSGLVLSLDHLEQFVKPLSGSEDAIANAEFANEGEKYLKTLDYRIYGLRCKVSANHTALKRQMEKKLEDGVDCLKLPRRPLVRISHAWAEDEKMVAIMGFRKYGKNYEKISSLIQNKSPDLVAEFFEDFKDRYNLEKLVDEFKRDELRRAEAEAAAAKAQQKREPDIIDLS